MAKIKSTMTVEEVMKAKSVDKKTATELLDALKKRKASGGTKRRVSERTKLTDVRKSVLTVSRQQEADGSWLVKAQHLEKEGAQATTGMAQPFANEEQATKRYNELVELAKKAGWTVMSSGGKRKEVKNEWNVIPPAGQSPKIEKAPELPKPAAGAPGAGKPGQAKK